MGNKVTTGRFAIRVGYPLTKSFVVEILSLQGTSPNGYAKTRPVTKRLFDFKSHVYALWSLRGDYPDVDSAASALQAALNAYHQFDDQISDTLAKLNNLHLGQTRAWCTAAGQVAKRETPGG